MTHFLSLAITITVVMLCIYIHYEAISRLSMMINRLPIKPRSRIILGVVGALLAHSVEVFVFAVGFALGLALDLGSFAGSFDGGFEDLMYFSYAAFTTVGFGDIVPEGLFRWMTGIEALTGFVLITWTASFLFLEMSRNWPHD